MSLTQKNQLAIAFKKLVGRSHTSPFFGFSSEVYPSNIQIDNTTIFGDEMPTSPSSTEYAITNGIVEKVHFVLEEIPSSEYLAAVGNDTGDGVLGSFYNTYHAYRLKLPSTYQSNSSNPKKTTGFFINSQIVAESNGLLQIIPEKYGSAYRPKVFSVNGEIAPSAEEDFYLDTYSGILFLQDPRSISVNDVPSRVEAYLYIGSYSNQIKAVGDNYTVQFNSGSFISGSENLIYNYDTGIFSASSAQIGYLDVDTISARVYNSEVVNAIELYEFGSTKFGNTTDDVHQFTGSIRQAVGANNYFLSNVGIGTTTPNHTLDVSGSLNVSGSTGQSLFKIYEDPLSTRIFSVNDSTGVPVIEVTDDGDITLAEYGGTTFIGGNVGIGTASPDQTLHVHKGSAGTVTANINSVIVAENSVNSFISILAPDANSKGIIFGEPSSPLAGGIFYNSNVIDGLDFRTNNNQTRMVIDSAGNVGIGTTSPQANLHVNGSLLTDSYLVYKDAVTVPTGQFIALKTDANGSVTLNTSHRYIYRLTTTGTGTQSGAYYVVSYNSSSSTWVARAVSLSGGDSNHPLLRINLTNNGVEAYHNHASAYAINYILERYYTGEDSTTGHFFGAHNHWQRTTNTLFYNDGNVGIGTTNPVNKLQVEGTGFFRQDVTIGDSTTAADRFLTVFANDGNIAEIRAMGAIQGTGVVFVGQQLTNGGGIFYNGDGSPAYATGETNDRVSFFRRADGTNHVVFEYPYNSNDVAFKGNASFVGDLAVNGGDLTTTATTFNLLNTTATTLNFAGASTALTIGATTGTTTIRNANTVVTGDLAVNGGDLTTTATTFNLLNATAATIGFAGASTALTIGATTGTTTIRNANTVVTGDLAVNGGDLTTTATSFNLLNTTAATLNFAGASTNLNIGATTGTTTIRNNLQVLGSFEADTITAREYYTEFVSASVIYQSGSTKFGNSQDDIHQFTGSVFITGAVAVDFLYAQNITIPGGFNIDVTSSVEAFSVKQSGTGPGVRITQTGGPGAALIVEDDGANPDLSPFIIDANGNVGIGTATPDQTLHVHKGSAGTVDGQQDSVVVVESNTQSYISMLAPNNYAKGILFGEPSGNNRGSILYYGSTVSPADQMQFRNAGSQTRMVIDSAGNVLIGGATTARANIFGSLTPRLQIEGTDASTSSTVITRNSADTNPPYLALLKSRGTTGGSNTIVQTGDTLGHISFEAADGGSTPNPAAFIRAIVEGTPAVDNVNARVEIGPVLLNTPTPVLVVNSSQNVGIGTTDPGTYKLKVVGSFSATTKSFDIEHPTKPNMRLRYGSLEGPENGVYVRGKTKQKVIQLPDYWTGLVDEDTITVNLTPLGVKQDIWVEKIENNTLYIAGDLQECYFTVFGERKDVDQLTVEY